jgi:3-methyladenine DNA glycosylase AlkD
MSASQLSKTLRQLGDPAIAAHSQGFFKTGPGEYAEGDRFLGIRVPVLRTQAKRYREMPLPEILQLLTSPYHEERLCSLLLLVERFTRGDASERSEIFHQYLKHTHHINNWDLVDSSAPQIVGAYLAEKDKRPLYLLAGSQSLWERRIAIMASFHFIRQHHFDVTLSLAERLLSDRETLIHKAVGWMLREVGNRDGKLERRFLQRHYETMPRTMLRYAIEKFPPEERKRYLKSEI